MRRRRVDVRGSRTPPPTATPGSGAATDARRRKKKDIDRERLSLSDFLPFYAQLLILLGIGALLMATGVSLMLERTEDQWRESILGYESSGIYEARRPVQAEGRAGEILSITHRRGNTAAITGKESEGSKDTVMWFIPGNPGNPGWYRPFARHMLMDAANDLVSVEVISHASHTAKSVHSNARNAIGALNTKESGNVDFRVGLEEQVAFHTELLRQRVDRARENNKRLVVSGHSIGCWIALRALDNISSVTDAANVVGTVLITPTIHSIGLSENAFKMETLFSHMGRRVADVALFLLSLAPTSLRTTLADVYFRLAFHPSPSSLSEHLDVSEEEERMSAVRTLVSVLSDWRTLSSALFMGSEEMKQMPSSLDDPSLDLHSFIKSFLKEETAKGREGTTYDPRILFLYALNDGWIQGAVQDEVEKMQELYGENVARLLPSGVSHGFVMGQSEAVARDVTRWMIARREAS